MVKSNSQLARFLTRGFTLIELMVTIGVMGVIAGLAVYGIKKADQTEPVNRAQQDFLASVRSMQNKVENGVGGVSVRNVVFPRTADTANQNVYYLDDYNDPGALPTETITLPSGVFYQIDVYAGSSLLGVPNRAVACFANPNLKTFSTLTPCGTNAPNNQAACSPVGSNYFVCTGGASLSPIIPGNPADVVKIEVTFQNASRSIQRTVAIEGAGMKLNRIYAK